MFSLWHYANNQIFQFLVLGNKVEKQKKGGKKHFLQLCDPGLVVILPI
jgi:hypothetical protein